MIHSFIMTAPLSLRDIALLAPTPFVACGDISPRSGESPCTANVVNLRCFIKKTSHSERSEESFYTVTLMNKRSFDKLKMTKK